jgi:hypothetical protein
VKFARVARRGTLSSRKATAATSFFRAGAGAIETANRPSPETRAGTSRQGSYLRRALKWANTAH